MEKKYSNALSNSNILFGIHCLFKGILILLLFIILYSVIWTKEKYLNYIKISIYFQIFIFLFILTVILITNNPGFFDICLKCTFYTFLILSILQIIIIIIEITGVFKNFQNFKNFFHECAYYRSYNDIMESKYQRSCLFMNDDPYSEEEGQYKYVCYYNSEEEYYNKFCDGLICRQNNKFYNNENDFTKCSGININLVKFPGDNQFYQKERYLFNRMKNKKVYICSRKKRLDNIISNDRTPNNKYSLNNLECPDNNPSKKYIVFIYIEIIMHLIIDLLFIYEIFVINNLNNMYYSICLNNNNLPINTIDSQSNSNSSNNRVNTPSANEVMVNDAKRNKNSENDEDIKVNLYKNNINFQIDINNERQINIMNLNQNNKINKNNNGGTLLINALKSPKGKDRFKNRRLKEKEKENRYENECLDIINKKHHHLKSSQLKNLIKISIDNSNNNSLSQEKDIKIKKIKELKKINKKYNITKEGEKSNKIIYIKKNNNLETNLNTPFNKNIKIVDNSTKEKSIATNNFYRNKVKEIKDINENNKEITSYNEKEKKFEENKEEKLMYINNDNKIINKILMKNNNEEDFKNNIKDELNNQNTESKNLNTNDFI